MLDELHAVLDQTTKNLAVGQKFKKFVGPPAHVQRVLQQVHEVTSTTPELVLQLRTQLIQVQRQSLLLPLELVAQPKVQLRPVKRQLGMVT